MLDILQLRIDPAEFDQLRLCQIRPRRECHAAFTVKDAELIWPMASWGDTPATDRINVRGWFPLLDKIADEFLIWWPQGGCFVVARDAVSYRRDKGDRSGVLFLELAMNQAAAEAGLEARARRVRLAT